MYTLTYRIGDGIFTLTGNYYWVDAQWSAIKHNDKNARLIACELGTERVQQDGERTVVQQHQP